MLCHWLYGVLLVTVITLTLAQDDDSGNPCLEQTSCGACIAANSRCGWCMQIRYDDTNRARCDYVDRLIAYGCDDNYLVTPSHQQTIDRADPPRNSDDTHDAIQLTPQELTVELRPNMPYTLNLTYRQAENYPVDLYYVMDLSFSMLDDKKNLADLGSQIAEEMSKITKNFMLGFGSYVDKKTMPYVSIVPNKLQEPCDKCVPPYGFRNQLPLTERAELFTERVNQAPISGNLDSPEGTFDAMMQAIACKGDIGWREASRKMLLVSTDNDFHYAGDGKLGGIVTPNDGHCHLIDNEYSESLNQDYPSVSQLAYRIAEEKINVIFAITKEQLPKFNRLSGMIEGAMVGELANDSSNIVKLIKDNYERISGKVTLKTESSEGIDVQFKTKCLGDEERELAHCDNLGVGDSVSFQVTVEVTECPKDPAELKKTLTIYPVGLTEKLTINLNLVCSCPCEKDTFKQIGDVQPPEENSAMCNNSGTYMCGACSCNEERYGDQCQCDGSTVESGDYEATCRKPNGTDSICEGNGRCECGRCVCNPLYVADPSKTWSGKFCDCNNYGCDFVDGDICGGKTQGICKCGKCQCKLGYTGKDCNCPTSEESCMASNGLKCNGKGECVCGRCHCTLDRYYKGRTCEDCPSCPGHCDANKACVQCTAFGTGPLSPENCTALCDHVTVKPQIEKEEMSDRRLCMSRDEDDCDFWFTYFYDNDKVIAQEEKDCPEPVNVLAIVLGVIGGIIAIGLALLLIGKLLVTLHDRREFAKFEKERQNAKWDMGENPIFKPSTSTFQNPTYAQK